MSSTYRPVPSQVPSASTYPPYEKSSNNSPPILAIASSKERTRLVGLKALVPVFMVVLLSGGLATVLVLWLHTHEIVDSPPQTLATVWQTGYFLADEGTEVVNGLQRAKANGLTISAATSHVISSTTSVISGIFAYRIAAQFLEFSNLAGRGGGTSRLPTPLQFALLLCLCHAGTLGAMGAAFVYILKKGSRKAPVSPLLKQAVVLVTFAYILTHGVGLADFFLHKNTATVRYLLKDKKIAPTSYGRALNFTACSADWSNGGIPFNGTAPNASPVNGYSGSDGYLGCYMGFRDEWGGETGMDPNVKNQGLLSVANSSANTLATLISPGSSLAVPPLDDFPHDERSTFSSSSIAISVDCKAIPKCFSVPTAGTVANCTVGGQTINATIPGIFGAPKYDEYGAIPNPFQFLLWFQMDASGDSPPSYNDPASPGTWFAAPNGPIHPPEIVTLCKVSVNETEYTFLNGTHTIDTTSHASGFVAGAIFGPTIQLTAASVLSGQIEVLGLTASTVSDYEKGLSNILAIGMVARASGLLMPVNTTDVVTFSSMLITQYPIVPLFILLLLLYTYAILAVSLMIAAILTPSSHITLNQEFGEPTRVSTLALAQRSIVSPLSIIAAMFARELKTEDDANGHGPATCARASVALEDTALFEASEHTLTNPPRVTIGLGGGNAAQPIFGLWLADEEKSDSLLRDPTPFSGLETPSR